MNPPLYEVTVPVSRAQVLSAGLAPRGASYTLTPSSPETTGAPRGSESLSGKLLQDNQNTEAQIPEDLPMERQRPQAGMVPGNSHIPVG